MRDNEKRELWIDQVSGDTQPSGTPPILRNEPSIDSSLNFQPAPSSTSLSATSTLPPWRADKASENSSFPLTDNSSPEGERRVCSNCKSWTVTGPSDVCVHCYASTLARTHKETLDMQAKAPWDVADDSLHELDIVHGPKTPLHDLHRSAIHNSQRSMHNYPSTTSPACLPTFVCDNESIRQSQVDTASM